MYVANGCGNRHFSLVIQIAADRTPTQCEYGHRYALVRDDRAVLWRHGSQIGNQPNRMGVHLRL